MKSIIVTGLESSCTRHVSKLLCLNLIGDSNWNGQYEVCNSKYKITHFSLPENTRKNFGSIEYFNSFDTIIICTRDFYCSLFSKNKTHQKDLQKAYQEHLEGKAVLKKIYKNFYEKVVLYCYETAFILGEEYNYKFLSNFNNYNYNFSNIPTKDINHKYMQDISTLHKKNII